MNTETISSQPAHASAMAKARKLVNVCARFPNADAVMDGFEALGHKPGQTRMTLRNGKELISERFVAFDDQTMIVEASESHCFIGLRGMTPQQSYQLAQIWVRKFNLATNAELGQGLSDHAVQAWQSKSYPTSKILVAAHKTWPWDRGRWPKDEPGAAVTLFYRANR